MAEEKVFNSFKKYIYIYNRDIIFADIYLAGVDQNQEDNQHHLIVFRE